MDISSPGFEDGGELPEKHGYPRQNVNPELEIRDVPENAESLALIVDDPDAMEPAGKIWVHWTLWNIPANQEVIEENKAPGIEGTTDFRETGYNGPNPPDGEHTYYFRLFALDKELNLDEGASRKELDEAMKGHIIEKTKLKGRFDRIEE